MTTRRLSLNSTQVAASVLATLTGAIAASYLGVGGTLTGAAVGSIASTVGSEVYRHYLGRTQERLRGAVVARRYRTVGRTAASRADPTAAQNRVGVTSQRQSGTAAADETEVLPVLRPGNTRPGAGNARRPLSHNDPLHDSPTETFAIAASRAQGSTAQGKTAQGKTAQGSTAGTPGATGRPGGTRLSRRRRWLIPLAATAGSFLVVLAAISVFEVSVGKPLDAVVWHRHGGGTTLGHIVGGNKTGPAAKHTATPSAQPKAPPSTAAPASSPTSSPPTPASPPPPTPGSNTNTSAANPNTAAAPGASP
jgi:hypothetical protein